MIASLSRRRVLQVCVSLVVALGMPVVPALAHSMLVKAEPPRRAVLTKSPSQVRLWFNEKIEGITRPWSFWMTRSSRSAMSSRLSLLMTPNRSSYPCLNCCRANTPLSFASSR